MIVPDFSGHRLYHHPSVCQKGVQRVIDGNIHHLSHPVGPDIMCKAHHRDNDGDQSLRGHFS